MVNFLGFVTLQITTVVSEQSQDSPPCDMNRRNTTCPSDRCCVQDEYQPEYIYCKRIGQLGHSCSTTSSQSTCPCADGLFCKPNIDVPTLTSLYGRCADPNTPDLTG